MRFPTITLLLSLAPTMSFAFFCPTNFNQIDFGNTTDQVIAQCGEPAKQETKDQTAEGPQEWSYFIPQTVPDNAMSSQSGTLKATFSFDGNGKVVNMTVNGIGVGASDICGSNIQLGQTRDQIKAACGEPGYINASVNPATTNKPPVTKVTTFTYTSNPPVKLIFENGILKSKN